MGREVRRVPADWQHPHEPGWNGVLTFKPLLAGNVTELQAEWDFAAQKWAAGKRTDFDGGWKPRRDTENYPFERWAGARPALADYMPQWTESEAAHYMMYETRTEGTPISPAFASPEELAQWLTDNSAKAFGPFTASYEVWLRIIRRQSTQHVVLNNGELKSGVDL